MIKTDVHRQVRRIASQAHIAFPRDGGSGDTYGRIDADLVAGLCRERGTHRRRSEIGAGRKRIWNQGCHQIRRVRMLQLQRKIIVERRAKRVDDAVNVERTIERRDRGVDRHGLQTAQQTAVDRDRANAVQIGFGSCPAKRASRAAERASIESVMLPLGWAGSPESAPDRAILAPARSRQRTGGLSARRSESSHQFWYPEQGHGCRRPGQPRSECSHQTPQAPQVARRLRPAFHRPPPPLSRITRSATTVSTGGLGRWQIGIHIDGVDVHAQPERGPTMGNQGQGAGYFGCIEIQGPAGRSTCWPAT